MANSRDAELVRLLASVRRVLQGTSASRGAAFVERTCVTGSLARGTFADGCEATGLVMFLNADLQFAPHEAAQALGALASSLTSELELGDSGDGTASLELQIVDAECRGGLWACLRAAPQGHFRWQLYAAAGAAAGTSGANGPVSHDDRQQLGHSTQAELDEPYVLQLYAVENMTGTVSTPRGAAGTGAAAGAEGALDVGAVDGVKAVQQQQNLLELAEQRLRREARHQARHTRAGVAVSAAAWVAKMSCGVAEARRVFWSRQPEAVLRAARAAHRVWSSVLQAEQQAVSGAGTSDGGRPAQGPSGRDGIPSLWSDEVMLLLDVLALHICRSMIGQAAAEGHVKPQDAAVTKIFTFLSRDFTAASADDDGLQIAIPGGVLAADGAGAVADAPAGGAEAARGVAAAVKRGLVLQDPCFPVLDLYASACVVVGQSEGADAGQRKLQLLAAAASSLVASVIGARDAAVA